MIQPYLINSDLIYTSVDGLIWLSSGLKLPTNLEEKACEKLADIYTSISTELPLIIDFRNIRDVADRALESLFQIFETNNREVILINYENIIETIDKNINEHYHKNIQSKSLNDGACFKVLNHNILDGNQVLESVNKLRIEKVEKFVSNSFVEFDSPRYLSSTPIKSTGIYDASKLIKEHTSFYWICLQLSEKLKELLNSGDLMLGKKELRLLTVNLKSCPFASVVSLLNNIPLVTIDHLGPKHKVHDLDILDSLENLKQYSYIYVGDFCVGGTEIKIAKTYAGISNSDLNTAIVIGSYYPAEVFKSFFEIHSIVSINNLNSKAKFEM